MKTTRRIFTGALTALALAAISTGVWAAPKECGIVGTWSGMDMSASPDIAWLGIHTPGTSDSRGAMVLDWIAVSPSAIAPAVRLTPGRGVWEQVAKGQYKYTWYAYGIDVDGFPIVIIRVGGSAVNNGCNQIDIGYRFEIFAPLTEEMMFPHQIAANAVPAIPATNGTAVQYRVPLAP